jgi:hypothetical protein
LAVKGWSDILDEVDGFALMLISELVTKS